MGRNGYGVCQGVSSNHLLTWQNPQMPVGHVKNPPRTLAHSHLHSGRMHLGSVHVRPGILAVSERHKRRARRRYNRRAVRCFRTYKMRGGGREEVHPFLSVHPRDDTTPSTHDPQARGERNARHPRYCERQVRVGHDVVVRCSVGSNGESSYHLDKTQV